MAFWPRDLGFPGWRWPAGGSDDLHVVSASDIHGHHMNTSRGVVLTDFNVERTAMVDSQLRTNGVLDVRVLSAFLRVPRENFVPDARRAVAYIDSIQPLGVAGRSMGSPATLGRMLQLAEVQASDSVLDIGTGLGYSAAILSLVAKNVVAIEPDAGLAAAATRNLSELGFGNVGVIESEDALPEQARFDVIHIGWSVPEVPKVLLDRLNPGGRLVAVIGSGRIGVTSLYVSAEGGVTARAEFDAHLPFQPNRPLIQDFVF